MEKIIVLVTEGKHDSVDYVTVLTFDDNMSALKFCKANSTGKQKYWQNAEIVKSGQKVDLGQPDFED